MKMKQLVIEVKRMSKVVIETKLAAGERVSVSEVDSGIAGISEAIHDLQAHCGRLTAVFRGDYFFAVKDY